MRTFTHKPILLVALAIISSNLMANANVENIVTSGKVLDTVGGKYGADLINVSGATVRTDYDNAYITNTSDKSILNWGNLNTAPRQSLNFIMKDGQISLNNVTGGLSQFAGALTAEHGRVIISNPNGIIFESGSFVNANALTLTTHNVFIDNDDLILVDSNNNSSITFEGGLNAATRRVMLFIAKDLNIVANNIDIKNADIVAGDTRLVTTDGVTFFSVNNTNVSSNFDAVINKNNYIDNGNINLNNTTIAVKNKETGAISIVSRGDVSANGGKFVGNTKISAMDRNIIKNETSSEVITSQTKTEDVYGSGNISNWKNFWDRVSCFFTGDIPKRVLNGQVYKTTETTVKTTTKNYDLVSGRGNVTLSNVSSEGNFDIDGANVKINNSSFDKLQVASSGTKTTSYTRVDVTTDVITKEAKNFIVDEKSFHGVAKKGHFDLENVTPTKTTNTVLGEALANATTLTDSVVTLDKITSSGSVLVDGDKIQMYNSTVGNIDLVANSSDVDIYNVKATDDYVSRIYANRNINVKKGSFKSIRAAAADIKFTDTDINYGNINSKTNVTLNRTDSRKKYSVKESTIVAGQDINLNDSVISDSLLIAGRNISANKANISNTEINADRNIYAGEGIIENSILAATNDIIVGGSKVSNSTLTAQKDLKLANTVLNNTKANGRYGFLKDATLENGTQVSVKIVTNDKYEKNQTVENVVIKNSKLISSDSNINLKDAIIENGSLETAKGNDVNIETKSDITLAGINIGGNLNIKEAGNVIISNSKENGNKYIPDMTNKESITDYDKTKFDENYFKNIIKAYGEDYGKDSKISNIDGNVNITNSKGLLIINSVIGGDLTTENISETSNLVNSLVSGNYVPDRISSSAVNVYDSFINGDFEAKYANQVVETEPKVGPETKSEVSSNDSQDRISNNQIDDHNRKRYGSEVNAKFEKRFSPRGFAASEDEVKEMKSQIKVLKKGNKIKTTKDFHAY